ncbi:MAG: ABC transporter ATP-binding protein [Alphaproteobacteria bacterium]|nr:ABC transporter ATP-binding protein [Alphaproteobacteria bacterium]
MTGTALTGTEGRPLFEVRGLTKRYYGLTAVADLGFTVPDGGIVGLIGPNGSGKSTTIDCISGFQAADEGRWFLGCRELSGRKPHVHALAGLARTFQTVRAYDAMSLLDNLATAAQAHDGLGWWQALRAGPRLLHAETEAAARARNLLDIVGLADHAESPAGILSYGQRKLLAIAATMMTRPRLVVLDEPVAGVNPTMIRRIETAIRALNESGAALLIVEHNIDFIMNLCRTVIVLEQGRKIAEGPPASIRENPRVLAAYLGGSPSAGADA